MNILKIKSNRILILASILTGFVLGLLFCSLVSGFYDHTKGPVSGVEEQTQSLSIE